MVAVVASIGYVRTKNALDREATQRTKAEATAGLAIEALDRMFERFSPARMRIVPQSPTGGTQGEAVNVPSSPILSREAAALLEEMLPFYDRLAQQTGNSDKLRLETAKANHRVGTIRQRLGQTDEAVKAYRRSLALYDKLRIGSPTNPAIKLATAQVNNELGRIYTSQRQVAEAREAHKAALALLEAGSAELTASPELRFELARTCYLLGTQERPLPGTGQRKAPGPARPPTEQGDFLAKSVALLQPVAGSPSGNPEAQHLLALCYLEGAPVEGGHGPAFKAGADHAIEILEGLVKAFPKITDYAYDLSEAYARIHIPQPPIPREEQEQIEDRLAKSVALLRKLTAEHPDVPDFPAAQARACDKLGSFHRHIEDWEKAELDFREAIALQAPLVKQFPDAPSYWLWMATFRIALADVILHRNQPEEARKTLEDTISTLLSQIKARPDIPPPHGLLALGYSKLAVSLRQVGEKDQSYEAELKAKKEESLASGSR
jgi:tetratricopeptide (TPR) repeat protein